MALIELADLIMVYSFDNWSLVTCRVSSAGVSCYLMLIGHGMCRNDNGSSVSWLCCEFMSKQWLIWLFYFINESLHCLRVINLIILFYKSVSALFACACIVYVVHVLYAYMRTCVPVCVYAWCVCVCASACTSACVYVILCVGLRVKLHVFGACVTRHPCVQWWRTHSVCITVYAVVELQLHEIN